MLPVSHAVRRRTECRLDGICQAHLERLLGVPPILHFWLAAKSAIRFMSARASSAIFSVEYTSERAS